MVSPFRPKAPLRGVLAIYEDPDRLLRAASQAREQGFDRLEAYAPYPVHGLSQSLGVKKSWVPYATLVTGLSGAGLGLMFQIWTSAVDWPINVGGKPFVSLPAFVPVMFELGVLIGGTMTVAALLVACGLPDFKSPILDRRLTDDRFALWVPDLGPAWNEARTVEFLRATGASEVKVIREA